MGSYLAQRISSRPNSWASRGPQSDSKGGLAMSTSSSSPLQAGSNGGGKLLNGGPGGQGKAGGGGTGGSTPVTRGPNRVDNGRWRALAGGSNAPASPSSTGAMANGLGMNLLPDGSEEDLTDPEAMAAHELKHFSAAVQNIISAYLNRARWEAVQGQQQTQHQLDPHRHQRPQHQSGRRASLSEHHRRRLSTSSMAELTSERPRRGSTASSSGHSARKSIGSLDAVLAREEDTEDTRRPSTSSGLASASRGSTQSMGSSAPSSPRHNPRPVFGSPTKMDLAPSHSSLPPTSSAQMNSSSNSSSNGSRPVTRHRSNTGSSRSARRLSTSSNSAFPSLPKEYEWAHQASSQPHHLPLPPKDMARLPVVNTTTMAAKAASSLGDGVAALVTGPSQTEYHPDMVYLCAPFVKCIRAETGMYFAFEKLLTTMEAHHVHHPLPSRISTFLTLFRTTLPELYAYFDEEEVDVIGLASAWLRHLLAAEMRIEDLMRLWDTYFAMPDFLDLHTYVCLAILTNCKDALEELDQSEAKSMLSSLPPLDVDRVSEGPHMKPHSPLDSQADSCLPPLRFSTKPSTSVSAIGNRRLVNNPFLSWISAFVCTLLPSCNVLPFPLSVCLLPFNRPCRRKHRPRAG